MGDKKEKRTKSFSLKLSNADKVEKIAFDKKVSESSLVDKMIEGYEDGDR